MRTVVTLDHRTLFRLIHRLWRNFQQAVRAGAVDDRNHGTAFFIALKNKLVNLNNSQIDLCRETFFISFQIQDNLLDLGNQSIEVGKFRFYGALCCRVVFFRV